MPDLLPCEELVAHTPWADGETPTFMEKFRYNCKPRILDSDQGEDDDDEQRSM